MSSHPLVISYYTPSYRQHARRLIRSVARLELRYRIEERPSTGLWVQDCAQKALFIQEMREEMSEPVLWIDADAVLNRPLHELEGCTADLAAVRREGWSFSGGQIYICAGPDADRIMDIWCHYCREFPHIWDQVSLGYAWWEASLSGDVTAKWLPEGIFDKAQQKPLKRLIQRLGRKPAIFHAQASRKSETNKKVDSFTTWHVPHWWREAAMRDQPFPLTAGLRQELGLP